VTATVVDVVVIGGGAAGLMCAQLAGKRGRRVLVLEGSNKPGKKILMSGGGRCNFTHLHSQPGNFISRNSSFCISALRRYTPADFVALVDTHGVAYHEKTAGQLFCDRSSRDILDLLLLECQKAGVELRTQVQVNTVRKDESTFIVTTSEGEVHAASLIVASGGLSIPKMGASGFGYKIAEQFGLQIVPTRAGRVPFEADDSLQPMCERLSGVSLPVELSSNGQSFADDLLFTHRGMSGPAALQLSSYWQDGEEVSVDFLPGCETSEHLVNAKRKQPSQRLRAVLSRDIPKRLCVELGELLWADLQERPLAEFSDRTLRELGDELQHWQWVPRGTEGYRKAEVTLGGVDTAGLSSTTMESRSCAGLYFIGEVVDVTGQLGGHNFQWAWASAHAAGGVC